MAIDRLSPAYRELHELLTERGYVSQPGSSELLVRLPSGHEAIDALLRQWLGREPEPSGGWVLRGAVALDLLGELFEQSGEAADLETQELYRRWCFWSGERGFRLRVQRTDPLAVLPSKERVSDSGYDLTLIAVRKIIGNVTLYGTGLIIEPPPGWYFDVVARSSIIKTGHMLANNVGVIDRAYRGEVMVPLVKIDPDAAPLELPCRLAQLIPRRIVHFEVQDVSNLNDSTRGAGGFGSTGG